VIWRNIWHIIHKTPLIVHTRILFFYNRIFLLLLSSRNVTFSVASPVMGAKNSSALYWDFSKKVGWKIMRFQKNNISVWRFSGV